MHELNLLISVAGILLVFWYTGRIFIWSLRALRQGSNRLFVGAAFTTNVIGLGTSVGGAVAGAALTAGLLSRAHGAVNLLGQVAGGLLISWLASAMYYRWLSGPIGNWFTGDEGGSHGR